MAVSRDAFCSEQSCGDETERYDGRQISIHVGLIDDVANQVGAESRATGGDSHHDERKNIFAPMRQALFGEQSPDQGKGAVALVVGRLQTVVVHLPSVGLKQACRAGVDVSLPAPKEIFKPKSVYAAKRR